MTSSELVWRTESGINGSEPRHIKFSSPSHVIGYGLSGRDGYPGYRLVVHVNPILYVTSVDNPTGETDFSYDFLFGSPQASRYPQGETTPLLSQIVTMLGKYSMWYVDGLLGVRLMSSTEAPDFGSQFVVRLDHEEDLEQVLYEFSLLLGSRSEYSVRSVPAPPMTQLERNQAEEYSIYLDMSEAWMV